MKKFLTLVLVLVLALGLTVPAMAFTSDTSEDEDHPYDLKIYLVEYDDNDLFGLVALPESDRGYAKNEVVAAVVELYVPDDEVIKPEEYEKLIFGGDNVDLDVTDNKVPGLDCTSNVDNVGSDPGKVTVAWDGADKDEIELSITKLEGEETYKWLFFAKVTDDEASLYAKLVDGSGSVGFATTSSSPTDPVLNVTLGGDDYEITKHYNSNNGGWYSIFDGDDLVFLYVDEDYKTTGMGICPEDLMIDDPDSVDPADLLYVEYAMGVNTKNELGVIDPDNNAKFLDTDSDEYEAVMDVYEDTLVDVFGMDYFKIGNYLRDSFFEDLVSGDTIIATVDIEPWTAYVTVPDNIVVDPPKTGDAASIMGFVMVALSGAGVVALRKRG